MNVDRNADDDLLRPSLQAGAPAAGSAGARPWRLPYQFYVAFFGGPLAATAIAWLNAGRLRMDPMRRHTILVVGILVSLGMAFVIGVRFGGAAMASPGETTRESRFLVRLGSRIVGLALAGLFVGMQKVADRLYMVNARTDPPYDSLWLPGVIAVVAGGILQAALVWIVVFLG